MKRLLGAGILVWAAASMPAAEAGVREQLQLAAVLRGDFEQVREVQGFRHPLRSRGRFVLARERGVLWQTEEPFPSVLALTRERLVNRDEDGIEQALVESGSTPQLAAVQGLLLALLAGDIERLAPEFEIEESTAADGGWRLLLRPRTPALARMFGRIELSGGRFVREVHIEEPGGDRSSIRFDRVVDTPAQLDAAEAALLD